MAGTGRPVFRLHLTDRAAGLADVVRDRYRELSP